MNSNLPPGVTQDMIDSQLDDMDGWPPELEGGCPDCGALTPDDEVCMSCVAANEGFKARSKRRDKKTIKERVYDEDIGF